ncbi:MAG: hypothetical protein QM755_08710 [Luteolibacter sp.]
MRKSKVLIAVGICVLLTFGGFAAYQVMHAGANAKDEGLGLSLNQGTKPREKSKSKEERPEDPVRGKALRDISHRWESLAANGSTGEELMAQQKLLASEAIATLGPSDEFLKFLDFLEKKRANDIRDWVIKTGAAELFIGEKASSAREWVVTLSNRQLRESFAALAGSAFKGTDAEMKTYLTSFGSDDHGQSATLVGYCSRLAQSDPDGALATFRALKPPKVEMGGIAGVMAAMPPTADFVKISGTFPDDSKSLAKEARSSLLRAWASSDPKAAAQYVLSNSKVAFPAQMAVVVDTWADKDSGAAAAWLGALSAGACKDEGEAALVRHWNPRDPSKAWQYVGQVGDWDRRVAMATLVFNEWKKADEAAATQAWINLFPQK